MEPLASGTLLCGLCQGLDEFSAPERWSEDAKRCWPSKPRDSPYSLESHCRSDLQPAYELHQSGVLVRDSSAQTDGCQVYLPSEQCTSEDIPEIVIHASSSHRSGNQGFLSPVKLPAKLLIDSQAKTTPKLSSNDTNAVTSELHPRYQSQNSLAGGVNLQCMSHSKFPSSNQNDTWRSQGSCLQDLGSRNLSAETQRSNCSRIREPFSSQGSSGKEASFELHGKDEVLFRSDGDAVPEYQNGPHTRDSVDRASHNVNEAKERYGSRWFKYVDFDWFITPTTSIFEEPVENKHATVSFMVNQQL